MTNFLHYVVIPEIAIYLIMEDMKDMKVAWAEAAEIMEESAAARGNYTRT